MAQKIIKRAEAIVEGQELIPIAEKDKNTAMVENLSGDKNMVPRATVGEERIVLPYEYTR
ncbi:hypothetical protein ACK8P5_12840 [Paenibacillus sp. EC2-1]|uniref:hypothetical protein n=1 Tax=Paenibacillus sp. EC2-1 TaxID=3388665 RepID=UPI003BEEF6B2